MFFNNYFQKEILMHQEGGGKCKYCGSEGTNSRTCPDNPDAKEKGIKVNPSKHPNAKNKKIMANKPIKIKIKKKKTKKVKVKITKKAKKEAEKKEKAAEKAKEIAEEESKSEACLTNSGKTSSLNWVKSRHKLNEWVLPNRNSFIEWLNTIYSEWHNSRRTNDEKEFFSHQEFVIHYLQKNSPYRGLLLYHGLGAGKTASSVAISEGLSSDKKIIVMLPASLRTNYENEIKTWGNILFKEDRYWCFVKTRENSKLEKQLIERGIPLEWISKKRKKTKKSRGAWMVNTKRTGKNPSLNKEDELEIQHQIDYLLKEKYTVLHYNNTNTIIKQIFEQVPVKKRNLGKITKSELLDKVYECTIVNPDKNPFNDKILIVDEIHNLISMMIGGGFNGPILYRLLMTAKRLKLIFLSGTPLINYPYEAGILCNILKGYSETFIFDIRQESSASSVDELIASLRKNILSIDRIDYKKGKLLVVRNPQGFISIWNRSKYKGVIQDAAKYSTHDEFIEDVDNQLKKLRWLKIGDVEIIKNPTFPEIINEAKNLPNNKLGQLNFKLGLQVARNKFQDYFIHSSNKITNVNLFMRRILGSISYYKRVNKSELFPRTLNYDGSLFKAENHDKQIKIKMSNWQLQQYEEVREIERNKDKKSRLKDNKKNLLNEIKEQANKTSSLYRILSRQRCNFVFPPNIERPKPYKKMVLEDLLKDNEEFEAPALPTTELTEAAEEMDYETKLDYAINKLSVINLVPKKSDHFRNLVDLLVKHKTYDNKMEDTIVSEYSLDVLSPKFHNMLDNINQSPGLVFLYSQFRSVEGIEIFSRVLKANGYKQYKAGSEKIPFNLFDMVSSRNPEKYLCGKIIDFNYDVDEELVGLSEIVKDIEILRWKLSYVADEAAKYDISFDLDKIINDMYKKEIYENTKLELDDKLTKVESILMGKKKLIVMDLLTKTKKEYAEDEINHSFYALWTGTEDPEEREIIRNKFNENENKYGSNIKILMITSSGAEGISLKNVRQVHIMEPYWNRVRIEQVIGRAARIKSHTELPKSKQDVRVYEYIVQLSEKQKKLPIAHNLVNGSDDGMTSDEVLYKISEVKSKILYGILTLMKRASIDCRFNELDNKMSGDDFNCFEFAEGASDEEEFSTTLDIDNADKDSHKKVKIAVRNDKFINIIFKTAFKTKRNKQIPARLKIKLDVDDDPKMILNISEPRLIYDYYTDNKIPLGIIYKGKEFFIKPKIMQQLIKEEISIDKIMSNLNRMRLSPNEIKSLTLPWVNIEISRMRRTK